MDYFPKNDSIETYFKKTTKHKFLNTFDAKKTKITKLSQKYRIYYALDFNNIFIKSDN